MNEILKILQEADDFIITSHIRPDGDSIGSQICLFLILKSLGKRVVIVNEDNPPTYFSFLPSLNAILPPNDQKGDIAIILDTNEPERLGKRTKQIIEKIPLKINIDHHIGKGMGKLNWIDENASSVCEMVYRVLIALSKKPTREIALLLYTGIATDTGFFSFRNTSPHSLRICAGLLEEGIEPARVKESIYGTKTISELRLFGKALLSLKKDDFIIWTTITSEMVDEADKEPETDTLLEMMREIRDARVIVLFRELSDTRTKVSLRSKEDFDIRRVAMLFGGGGHLCAAGCIIPLPIDAAEKKIISSIKNS